jgi:perosamine synthetase
MDLSGTRVLVTGGAGFIGSELVRQLAEIVAEVLAVDNLVNGRRENLEGLPGHVRLVEVDIRDSERMRQIMAGIDVVFHLACLGVRHSIHSPRENHDVNATATLDLLATSRAAGVRRFVYVSTSEVYGTAKWVPMREDHPTYPKTVYGASKLAGEGYARAYHDTYGFPTLVVRPFNTYGPRCHHEGDCGEVIPKFMLRGMADRPMMIFGDGAQTRDFTYVSDTARGILLLASAPGAVGETINLGSGAEIKIRDLAYEVGRVLQRGAPAIECISPRPGDVLRLYADPTKARDLCGYIPAVPFREGLAKLRDWYRSLNIAPELLLQQETVRNWEPGSGTHTEMDRINIAKPWIGEPEAQAARRVILSRWITQGPEVAAFEREFAQCVGAQHACAVSNCTTALHLALKVAGVGPGDEVITVSHSFIATANSVRYCGATPVFVDIDPHTFNIDPDRIEAALSARTRAILCVHQIGMPCDLRRILAIARAHRLPVIEDAACAIGSEILWEGRWEKIGKPHGDIACFSFHPRKLVSTGDGGMLTTARPEWDHQFRLLRQHCMDLPDTLRHASRQVEFERYTELGYNYRMTDIQAAVGREQLKRLPEMIERRRLLALAYHSKLAGMPNIIRPQEPAWARSNWQSYCIRLSGQALQKKIMQALLDRGISSRRSVMCAHREPAYASETWRCGATGCIGGVTCRHLLNSEEAQDHGLILPLFHDMTDVQQERVVDELVASVRTYVTSTALSK